MEAQTFTTSCVRLVFDSRRKRRRSGGGSRCHFVQNCTERKQIGSSIQFFALGLLRGHVGDGSKRRTGTGEMIRVHRTRLRVKSRNVARRTRCSHDLRQPEVENLGVPTLGDENVRGLDVTVDDAFCMGCIERVRNLDGPRQNQFVFHRSACNSMLQRQPIQKLRGDKVWTIALVNLEDHADVGMVQGRSGLSFALEAVECLRVFGHVVGQELESHKAAELYVLGLVNDAHTPTAQLLDDAVVRYGLADHWSRILRRRNGQVNESHGLGCASRGWLAKNRHFTPHAATGVLSVIAWLQQFDFRIARHSGTTSLYSSVCFGSILSLRFCLLHPLLLQRNGRYKTPAPLPTCVVSTPSATASPGRAAPTAPSCAPSTAARPGNPAPSRPALRPSTSAASRPSMPTLPLSCQAAKATSRVTTRPLMLVNHGSSSLPTPTKTASGTQSRGALLKVVGLTAVKAGRVSLRELSWEVPQCTSRINGTPISHPVFI